MDSEEFLAFLGQHMQAMLLQEPEVTDSALHDRGSASSSGAVVDEPRPPPDNFLNFMELIMNVHEPPDIWQLNRKVMQLIMNRDAPAAHEVRPEAQPLAVDASRSPSTRSAHIVEEEALKEPLERMESHFESEPSESTGLQLANSVSSHSIHEDLCKHRSTEVTCFVVESKHINLPPLLSKRVARSDEMDRKMDNKTPDLEDSLEVAPDHGSSKEGLPEELVERIICRIPFPAVFKAQVLSKSWFSKFPNPATSLLRPSFQDQITSVSSKWLTYCPVFLTMDKTMVCFDRSSSIWKTVFSLSYLPTEHFNGGDECHHHSFYRVTTAGPLVCFFHWRYPDDYTVFVTNVITKTWRKLPSLGPVKYLRGPVHVRLLQVGSGIYKFLLIFLAEGVTHVYNSGLGSWISMKFDPHFVNQIYPDSVYLDKMLHCLCVKRGYKFLTLKTYQVELGVWLEDIDLNFESRHILSSAIFVCKNKTMLVAWFWSSVEPQNSSHKVGIWEIDLTGARRATCICKGPPESDTQLPESTNFLYYKVEFASDAGLIYVYVTNSYIDWQWLLSYDVEKQVWKTLSLPPVRLGGGNTWVGLAFQPGSNPFILV